jgi:hypothetical protein
MVPIFIIIETSYGRTYVRTFTFQRSKASNNPNELQTNGGWLALENNSTKGMYQIKRLFERFIKSDGSHTGDNFTINGKKFYDFLNRPRSYEDYNYYGPINNAGLGCQLDYSAWTNSTRSDQLFNEFWSLL